MVSDDDFFVLRKFGSTSARVALYLQDQITQQEAALHHEDQICREAPFEEADSGTFRHDPSKQRRQILADLASSLAEYRKHLPFKMASLSDVLIEARREFRNQPFKIKISTQCYALPNQECEVMVTKCKWGNSTRGNLIP